MRGINGQRMVGFRWIASRAAGRFSRMAAYTRVYLVSALLLTTSAVAWAGTISGTVLHVGGGTVAGAEVQLWAPVPGKGLTHVDTVSAGRAGGYSFASLEPGIYRVAARGAGDSGAEVTDRWFDVAEPTADGWNPDFADGIELAEIDSSVTGIDIELLDGGGAFGRVTNAEGSVPDVLLRLERTGTNYGHDDAARERCCGDRDDWTGRFVMRGLVGSADYRMILYDPAGAHETQIIGGSFELSSGASLDLGDIEMTPIGDDPYEPNDSAAAPGANSIPPDLFHGESPSAFISEGALLGPRGSDLDWYCINARAHDRFLAYTSTDLEVPGELLENPWFDPILSVWAGGTTLITENDDGEGTILNAVVDTGDIPFAGRYCFVVSSFGDTDWSGAGQQTAGRYTLVVELGNRFPTLAATLRGGPVPPPPGRAIINEGDEFRIDFSTSDPDDDELFLAAELLDAEDVLIEDGTLTFVDGFGSFVWTVPDDAADHSPYQLTLTATDGEFTADVLVLLDPVAVNIPPFAPVLLSPGNGGTSPEPITELITENAVDLDGDPLTYEFELFRGTDGEGVPIATEIVEEGSDGITSWLTPALEENQVVSWRVRADDGLEGGVGEWSPVWAFVVNEENEIAPPPVLVKPDQDAIVPTQTPTLTVENSVDPDGDTLAILFEIAKDLEFTEVVRSSAAITQSTTSPRTDWTVEHPLDWGEAYYARAVAVDPLGFPTEFSNVRGFRVKANLEPSEPTLGGPLAGSCDDIRFSDGPPTDFVVNAVFDAEGEPLTIDFRIYDYDADVGTDEPIFQTFIEQPVAFVGEHIVPVDPTLFVENGHYLIRIQAADSETDSDWGECDFWINAQNAPPFGLTILSPLDGETVITEEEEVRIVFGNAVDEDGPNPTIRWCIVDELAGFECEDDPLTWEAQPQTDGNETEVFYPNIYEGAELTLLACAMDELEVCGEVLTSTFTIDLPEITVTPAFCGCGSTPTPAQRNGWVVIIGLMFAGLRRRRDR